MESLLEKEENKDVAEEEQARMEAMESLSKSPFWEGLSAENKEELIEITGKILLKNKTERNN